MSHTIKIRFKPETWDRPLPHLLILLQPSIIYIPLHNKLCFRLIHSKCWQKRRANCKKLHVKDETWHVLIRWLWRKAGECACTKDNGFKFPALQVKIVSLLSSINLGFPILALSQDVELWRHFVCSLEINKRVLSTSEGVSIVLVY